jgi:hypothetical protein
MKTAIKILYDELKEDMEAFSEMGILPINKLSGALRTMRDTLSKLKAHILKHPFANQAEEIGFFKKEKPIFIAEQLYAIDLCVIQSSRPRYDATLIREYLETELRQIDKYFVRYSFLYQYYQLDSTDMDAIFFLRGAYPNDVLVPDPSDLDPEFSTACDHAWGRFIAYERLRDWLLAELNAFNKPLAELQALPLPPGTLRWTGETVNLVELAYGIWLTGQINNGQVSITEIVEFLESVFRVRIGKPHRRWQSIASRKRLSYTKFLDECKEAIGKRVEEEMGK